MISTYLSRKIGNYVRNDLLHTDLNSDRVKITDREFQDFGGLVRKLGIGKKDLKSVIGIAQNSILLEANEAIAGSKSMDQYVERFYANLPKLTYDRLKKAAYHFLQPKVEYFPVESQAHSIN